MKKRFFIALSTLFFSTFCAAENTTILVINGKHHLVPEMVLLGYNDLLTQIDFLKRENAALKKQKSPSKRQVLLFKDHLVDEEVRDAYFKISKNYLREQKKKEEYKSTVNLLKTSIKELEETIEALNKEILSLQSRSSTPRHPSPLHKSTTLRPKSAPLNLSPQSPHSDLGSSSSSLTEEK